MPCEQELPQEKVRGGAMDGMWVIRPPSLSSLSLRDNLVSVFANSCRGLLCPPLCFSQLVGSCIVSSRGISAPRHAESLHRDRFGQKEEYRVLLPTFVSHAHTLFCPPFFPQRHLVTSIYSMAHGAVIETFLVASRYRYIPNTLGRKRSR